jgi:outer membrane protein, multidrug efflux system
MAAEPASSTAPEAATTLGDEHWVEIFQDATLQRLVQEALQNNLDLRIAAQRVLEAQAQVGITRSQQLPSLNGGAGYSALQIPSSLAGKNSDGRSANSSLPYTCS